MNNEDGLCLETHDTCHLGDGCSYFVSHYIPAEWDLNDLVAYALWYGTDNEEADAATGKQD